MAKRVSVAAEFGNEYIFLPGVCDVVMTRVQAYDWLKGCGYDPSERGIGSLDYMVFAARVVDEPLTDMDDEDVFRFLGDIRQRIRAEFRYGGGLVGEKGLVVGL